jgi:hypothetical protein
VGAASTPRIARAMGSIFGRRKHFTAVRSCNRFTADLRNIFLDPASVDGCPPVHREKANSYLERNKSVTKLFLKDNRIEKNNFVMKISGRFRFNEEKLP